MATWVQRCPTQSQGANKEPKMTKIYPNMCQNRPKIYQILLALRTIGPWPDAAASCRRLLNPPRQSVTGRRRGKYPPNRIRPKGCLPFRKEPPPQPDLQQDTAVPSVVWAGAPKSCKKSALKTDPQKRAKMFRPEFGPNNFRPKKIQLKK